ncbi:hypothetical protein GCM10029963_17270 [Micromonospora andamanensis]
MSDVSPVRRRQVIDALRRGAVPAAGLDLLAVGLERFATAVGDDLSAVAAGGSVFKAIRGEYGSGKTFFTRWIAEQAKRANFATAEVQISENETPLHKLETVYRRLTERLSTATFPPSALRAVVDGWFYALEEDVLATGEVAADDAGALDKAVAALLDQRLATVSRSAPAFAAALRGYRAAALGVTPPPLTPCWPGSAVSRMSRPPPDGWPAYAATLTTSRRSASCRACSWCCGTADIRVCCWCSTRSKRSKGFAPTPVTRPSTHCDS